MALTCSDICKVQCWFSSSLPASGPWLFWARRKQRSCCVHYDFFCLLTHRRTDQGGFCSSFLPLFFLHWECSWRKGSAIKVSGFTVSPKSPHAGRMRTCWHRQREKNVSIVPEMALCCRCPHQYLIDHFGLASWHHSRCVHHCQGNALSIKSKVDSLV